ncbi:MULTISPECIES: hypothetical protein [unclassified Capnocytophaga]|uniref:hypothetical protein n=1 Tax=unclassified Capnocytophaga TaxID=2640652 RepID=UPI000202ED89|nr:MULTISPECIES: hypothetical protein [unclassified Capnocytophaga]EGD33153.1 hypothetical protein HMPREF9071_2346 [Capnocytophaga sp. oral taxon 338 str. F0234]MEB3005414.1 hypothetical protein [Capnocytophaga sp. G2]
MEKCLFYTLALVGCWLLPIGVQTLISAFYEKYFSYTTIHGVSWSSFVYFVYYYFNPIGLLLAFLLFQWKKGLFLLPYGLLSLEILQHLPYRPLRTLLIWGSISIGYVLLFILLSRLKKQNTQNEKNL